jgi:hypothetical protein
MTTVVQNLGCAPVLMNYFVRPGIHRENFSRQGGYGTDVGEPVIQLWNLDGGLEYTGKSPDLLCGVVWCGMDRSPGGGKLLTSRFAGQATGWSPAAELEKGILYPGQSNH